jgi:hypothetical protein
MSNNHKNITLLTAGGRIVCLQCNAKSKRTGNQCRAPAAKGKTKCRFHGGASTGPKTDQGRLRCAEARTKTGTDSRKARTERSLAIAKLAVLESVGLTMGFISGQKTRGPKPKRLADASPELQAAYGCAVTSST